MIKTSFIIAIALVLSSTSVFAKKNKQNKNSSCKPIMNAIGGHAGLQSALKASVPTSAGGTGSVESNGGLDVPMWATIVGRDGTVCAIARSSELGGQWPISRIISAQKANTANGLTITAVPGLWSTARLFTPTQPGQFLFGLQMSNPVNAAEAYKGNADHWGTAQDHLATKKVRIGGINVFGGGLALWINDEIVGGVGVSGDTSCADHNVALRVRDNLELFNTGTDDDGGPLKYADNIIYDIEDGVSASGLGHPACPGGDEEDVNSTITGITHPAHDPWPAAAIEEEN